MSYFRLFTSYPDPKRLEIMFTQSSHFLDFQSMITLIQANPGFFVDFASRRHSNQFRSTFSCTCYTDEWPALVSNLLQSGYIVRQPAFTSNQHRRNFQREIRDLQDPLYDQYGHHEDQNEP